MYRRGSRKCCRSSPPSPSGSTSSMPLSPMALSWVTAHLKRRGLPCNMLGPAPSTEVKPELGATPLSPGELLQALGHRFISQPGIGEAERETLVKSNPTCSDKLEILPAPPNRCTPQRVAFGIAKLVQQHEERSATTKGATQSLLLLNTILTACARHALRYSRVEAAEGVNGSDDAKADSSVVSISPQVAFSWSASRAAGHLLHVFNDDAVQKHLRVRLWKNVSREHKQIVREATKLFDGLVAGTGSPVDILAETGVTREEMERLFYIPDAMVMAAREAILRLHAAAEPTTLECQGVLGEAGCGGELFLLSSSHFTYETSSQRLADLLLREVRESTTKRESLKAGGCEAPSDTSKGSQLVLAQRLCCLLMDMSRVRIATAVLMQFEILLRRYAMLATQPRLSQRRGGQFDSFVEAGAAVAAEELCTLAITSSSRMLEAPLHAKRFKAMFSVKVRGPTSPEPCGILVGGYSAVQPGIVGIGPFATLGSAFVALTVTQPPPRSQTSDDLRGGTSKSCSSGSAGCAAVAGDSTSGAPLALSTVPSGSVPAASSELHGSFMQWIMKAAGATSHRAARDGGVNESMKTEVAVAENAASASTQQRQEVPSMSTAPWSFRCCRMRRCDLLDVADMLPCGEKDAKVQLLRPSIDVPWPFRLSEVPVERHSGGERNSGCCGSQSSALSQATAAFTSAAADVVLRMSSDPSLPPTAGQHLTTSTPVTDNVKGIASVAVAAPAFTPMDLQHTAQLQRLLDFHNGRFLSINGCSVKTIKTLDRLTRAALRLVVRFR